MTYRWFGPTRVVEDTWSDSEGHRVWTVTERRTDRVAGARADRCLVFMSTSTVRRVWEYPLRWFELADTALLALSDARHVVFAGIARDFGWSDAHGQHP